MGKETAVISQDMRGDKLYQQRAREALPLLVRQALARKPIYYQQLAAEMGMPNPRNLNYVLGSVGQTLLNLGEEWKAEIPPIQCLVINQQNELPGEGFGWFMPQDQWKGLTKRQKAAYVDLVMQKIYAYPNWARVLVSLELSKSKMELAELLDRAGTFRSAGESEAHRVLKEHVRCNPLLVGLSVRCKSGVTEKRIPSGDSVDVFFETAEEWVGVEVKSSISDIADITRGLFQCIKYDAVMAAVVAVEQLDVATRCALVLGGSFPSSLIPLKHTLGVTVIDNVGA